MDKQKAREGKYRKKTALEAVEPNETESKKQKTTSSSSLDLFEPTASSIAYSSVIESNCNAIKRISDLFVSRTSADYSYADFKYLCQNENYRYAENSQKIAHAVIFKNASDQKVAMQFSMPQGSAELTPTVYQITDIEEIQRGGAVHYQAMGPDGVRWHSKRSEKAEINVDGKGSYSADIAYFSEEEFEDEEATEEEIWGSAEKIPRLLNAVSSSAPTKTKGGHELVVERESVLERDKDTDRGVSQNKVMGMQLTEKKAVEVSARDDYQFVFDVYGAYLSPKLRALFKKAFEANINKSPENQFRPEWLHAYGFSLVNLSLDPQTRDNLGASAKWVNTEMMVLERTAKWFALGQTGDTSVSIKTLYEMFDCSEIIDTIHFEAKIAFGEKYVRLIQELDSFKEHPLFRKASDVAQSTGITQALLHAKTPSKISAVSVSHSLFNDGSYPRKLFKPVPEVIFSKTSQEEKQYMGLIIDLETTDLDSRKCKIIELGALLVRFNASGEILSLLDSYNGLQDPEEALSDEVKRLTHITDEMLVGQKIDYQYVINMTNTADYIICHNCDYDRRVLEAQAPLALQQRVRAKPFACTMRDINWRARGLHQRNLIYLNEKVGFKFTGHRAINDCWATLNILREYPGALSELVENVQTTKSILCVFGNLYSKREQLNAQGFQFMNYAQNLPPEYKDTDANTFMLKFNYIYVSASRLDEMKAFIKEIGEAKVTAVSQLDNVAAVNKYSLRDGMFEVAMAHMPVPKPAWVKREAKIEVKPNRYGLKNSMLEVLMPYIEDPRSSLRKKKVAQVIESVAPKPLSIK